MKRWALAVAAILVATATVVASLPADASSGGVNNQNLQANACSSHSVQGSNTVTLKASKTNPSPSEQITITATVSGSQGTSDKMGVMLTTATSGSSGTLPSDKGWTIVSDPAGTKYNYVEKSGYTGSMTFTWTVKAPATAGSYTLYAKAFYGPQRYYKLSSSITATVTSATVNPPTVSITSPANGATVSGTISVSVTATADTGQTIGSVDLKIDGVSLGAKTASPYTWSLNTASYSNAQHILLATATDSGSRSASQQISVTISNSVPAPTVGITSPSDGATVSGSVTVSASVSAQATVTAVELRVDSSLIATDTTSPYAFTLDTTTLSKGTHTLMVTATDSNAKTGTASITVAVNNDPTTVAFTSPTAGMTASGTLAVSGSATAAYGRSIQSVTLFIDGTSQGADAAAPYSWSVNTLLLSNGAHQLRLATTDSSGYTASANISITVSNLGVSVAFTTPAAGASLSGSVSVTASASSGAGISSVTLSLDGAELGTKTGTPFTWQLDTSAYADGAHALNLTGTDALGRKAYAQVQVTFANSGPQVAISSPADGATVSGTVSVAATITSVNPVSYAVLMIDGVQVSNLTAAPFTWSFSTLSMTAGTHSLTVKAADSMGRQGQRTIQVTVQNPLPTVSISSPTDGSVVKGTITVSGSASSAQGIAYVEFLVDGIKQGNRTSAPFTWSLATTTLADGQHLLELRAVSALGLANSAVANVIVQNVNDVAIPAITITSPAGGQTLNGTISLAASISSEDPVLYVTVRIDDALYDMRSGPPYSWSIDSNTLSDGQHVIVITAVTVEGGVGVKSVSLIIYNPAPRLAMKGIPDGGQITGTVPATLTASSANLIAEMRVWIDGSLVALFDTGSGAFSLDSNLLANGQHILDAVAMDEYGKEGRLQTTFQVRNDAPLVSILAPLDGSRAFGVLDVQVKVVCGRDTQVSLKVDDLVVGTAMSPPFLFRIDSRMLADGSHVFTATSVDAYGKNGMAQISITVDNAEPTISLTMLPQGSVVNGEVLLEPEISAPNGVRIVHLEMDGIVVFSDAAAPFQYLMDTDLMENGGHLLRWSLEDMNGKTAELSVAFRVLNLPPTVTIAEPTGPLYGNVAMDITLGGASGAVRAWVEVDGVFQTTVTDGAFTLDTQPLVDGEHVLNITAEDEHGRRGYAEVTITVANSGPVVSILTPTAEGEIRRNLTVMVKIESLWIVDAMQVSVDGVFLGEVQAGPWAWPLDVTALAEGRHELRINAIDSRGMVGQATIYFATNLVPPELEISKPTGSSGSVDVSVVSNVPLTVVTYYLDGVEIGNVTATPFSLSIDTSAYADGDHVLNATAILDDGTEMEVSRDIRIMNSVNAPGTSVVLEFKDLDLVFLQVMVIVLILAVVLGRAHKKK